MGDPGRSRRAALTVDGLARVDDTPTGDAADGSRSGRLRARLAVLFEPVEPRPMSVRGLAAAAVALLVLAALCLSRVGSPGALNLAWGEDASDFLNDAYTKHAVDNIMHPVNGYFLVVPRLFAEFASLFPVEWGAGVLAATTALFVAAMAVLVYVASGSLLGHPLARAIAAAILAAAPLALTSSAAAVQFPMLYALFWCALWTPVSRFGRGVLVAFVAICAVSTFLAVLFVPLCMVRLWARRDRLSAAVLGGFLFGAAVQVAGLVSGVSSRGDISHPRWNPVWAMRSYLTWGLPYGFMGQTGGSQARVTPENPAVFLGDGTGPLYWVGVAVAWLLVLAVLAVALARWTSPRWLFAAVAGLHAVGMFCVLVMVQGELVLRYVFAPSLILVAALVALLVPRSDLPVARAVAPLVVLGLVLALSAVVNRQVDYSIALPWDAQVRQARAFCAGRPGATVKIRTGHSGPWAVSVPCARLR